MPPDADCALPAELKGIPAAIDAAVFGTAGNIAHIWSSYTLNSDGKQVARGINSIDAIKQADGWRVTGIMVQAESAAAPLPKKYLP
jgi:hypothetical protein